jgi:GT2 family glycosyltransferase
VSDVAAIVVTHGPAAELDGCLAALVPQVRELLLVENLPGHAPQLPENVRVLSPARPQGYAANANLGIGASDAPFVLLANPDTRAAPDAVELLRDFAVSRPRCGIAGPQLVYEDGSWQPSRRRFPTVSGTIVRRTPLRAVLRPRERQRSHYLLDERPHEPVESDWMLGAFLLLRRSMLEEIGGFDEGFRLYGEDIDLCYRAAKAGWERWYVPAAIVTHRYDAVIDRRFLTRRTIWHWRSMLRFARKHPERLRGATAPPPRRG